MSDLNVLKAFLNLNLCRSVEDRKTGRVFYVGREVRRLLSVRSNFKLKISPSNIRMFLLASERGGEQKTLLLTLEGVAELLSKVQTTRVGKLRSQWKHGTLAKLVVITEYPWYLKCLDAAEGIASPTLEEWVAKFKSTANGEVVVEDTTEHSQVNVKVEPEVSTYSDLVSVKDGMVIADSLGVAERFEKNHYDVVKKVRQILSGCGELNARNFTAVTYGDSKGEKRPMFEMTRDGFSFLVMGFTGRKADDWKWKYIAAFNSMEAKLRESKPSAPNHESSSFTSPAIVKLIESAMTFMATMQQTQLEILKVVKREDYSVVSPPTHLTVLGYAKMIEVKLDLKTAQKIGARATRICNTKGLEVRSVQDERYEAVNSYPIAVLTEIFADIYHGHTTQLPKPFKPN